MKCHKLKIESIYYDRLQSGQKSFEIRKNDRDYQVGDEIDFIVMHPSNQEIIKGMGDPIFQIDYITDYAQKDDYVVMALSEKRRRSMKEALEKEGE